MTTDSPDQPSWPPMQDHATITPTPEAPTPQVSEAPPSKSGVAKPILILLAVLTVALVGTTAMWITTSSSLSAEKAQVASLQQENQKLDDARAALESAEALRQGAAAEVPDLRAIANNYFRGVASVSGNSDSVSIATLSRPRVVLMTRSPFRCAPAESMAACSGRIFRSRECSHCTFTLHGVGTTRVSGWEPPPAAPASR